MEQRVESALVGILGPADHKVFGTVGEQVAERGHVVSYFDHNSPVADDDLTALSLLVSKRTRPESIRTLIRAERLGVPTWNSAFGVQAAACRLTQLCVLAGVGFTVPPTTLEPPPTGEFVAKSRFHWGPTPTVGGEGDFYEPLLETEPVDYKYYVVLDGDEPRVTALRTTSKLIRSKDILAVEPVDPVVVDRIVDLMTRLDLRAVGVDLLLVDGEWVAIDLNPCPDFEGTGLEGALADSITACLR